MYRQEFSAYDFDNVPEHRVDTIVKWDIVWGWVHLYCGKTIGNRIVPEHASFVPLSRMSALRHQLLQIESEALRVEATDRTAMIAH